MAKSITREKLAFDDPEALQALCGSNNSRLKLIERTAGAEVHLRGNEITIEGDEASTETAKTAIEQLYDMALDGKPLSSDDVVRAVRLLQGNDDGGARPSISSVFGETIITPRAGRPIAPKGATQKRYVDMVRANKLGLVVVDGSMAMEGNGPTMGKLVKMDVIVAGTNPLATDMVAASLMGFEPGEIPTFTWANKAGMKPESLDQIEVRGEPVERARRAFEKPQVFAWKAIRPMWGAKEI